MVIANPIYDVVFKRLMENEKVAKFFVSTLLDKEIISLDVQPQEFTYNDQLVGIRVFRLDFVALIKTENGHQKILIEIQKAKNQIDLMRFRNYLAEQYKKEDKVEGIDSTLPITTIYILGFNLPKINTACVKVEREYIDLINQQIITERSDFIEKLTHDCYVVQVERIKANYKTQLDKLLSFFEQSYFVDASEIVKEYNHEPTEEETKLMRDILHHSGTNPKEKKLIEIEKEAWRSVNAMFSKEKKAFQKAIEEKDQALEEKAKALQEKDRIIKELKDKLNKK